MDTIITTEINGRLPTPSKLVVGKANGMNKYLHGEGLATYSLIIKIPRLQGKCNVSMLDTNTRTHTW